MKSVDEVRGFQREILFEQRGYTTSGGIALTNCVVEVVESDWQGNCPVLSLRFYNKPFYSAKMADQSAEAGKPLYDENTQIGLELNLGPEIAQSLIDQINTKWPEYLQTLRPDQA